MSKPITRRVAHPGTRRVPVLSKSPEAAAGQIKRDPAPRPLAPQAASPLEALQRRLAALEARLEVLLARPQSGSIDEATEQALDARIDRAAEMIESAAAQRALDAVMPKIDEVVSERMKKVKSPVSPVDPRTIVEIVDTRLREGIDPQAIIDVIDQRLKEALEHRFRAMVSHLETDVIPRVLKKYASGV